MTSKSIQHFFFEEDTSKTIKICRILLGISLLVYFGSFIPRFHFYFWPTELSPFFAQLWVKIIFYVLALNSCFCFLYGYKTKITSLTTLFFFLLFQDYFFMSFGFKEYVFVAFAAVILNSYQKRPNALPLRILQIGLVILYAVKAWGQIDGSPWFHPQVVFRYVRDCPLAKIYRTYRGIIPLVEIIGGLAWLTQIFAPVLLWHKKFGKYWALGLILGHVLLELTTPSLFWNFITLTGLIAFLPNEWLTLNKQFWISHKPQFQIAFRNFSFFFLMLVMLFSVFDKNITRQFNIFAGFGRDSIEEKIYDVATKPFVEIGNLILFNSTWKMYSPTWRRVVWIEWYYKKDEKSEPVAWPLDNFSPDYRMHRRTWLKSIWTDFKKEKIFIGQLYRDEDRITYAKYLCHVIEQEAGFRPHTLRPEIYSFDIRGPEEDWSLFTQKVENVRSFAEIPCD